MRPLADRLVPSSENDRTASIHEPVCDIYELDVVDEKRTGKGGVRCARSADEGGGIGYDGVNYDVCADGLRSLGGAAGGYVESDLAIAR